MFGDEISAIKRGVPSVVVLITVLLLLRGVNGTLEALQLQVSTFAQSFLGGGDAFIRVLLHTLPLAIAAAAATFLIAAGWIRFEGVGSFLMLAVLIIAGATIGGVLQGFARSRTPPNLISSLSDRRQSSTADSTQIQLAGGTNDPSASNANFVPNTADTIDAVVLEESLFQAQPSPHQQLRELEWWVEPNLSDVPPADLPPVQLLPKTRGIVGVIFMAVNQLVGFLVAYQPRLFMAAVVAGGWTGYLWQRRVAQWYESEE